MVAGADGVWTLAGLGKWVTETIVPSEEATGRNLKEWFTKMLLDPEPNQYSVNQNVRKDGSRVWVAWSNTPIRDQFGKMEGLLCVGTDFSLRKQMEEQLTLASTVFEHAREAILITDPDGVILDSNNAFTRITGYSVEESRGQTPAMLSSGQHDHEFYRRMWQSLRRQGYWSGEIWNRRKNGEVYAEMLTLIGSTTRRRFQLPQQAAQPFFQYRVVVGHGQKVVNPKRLLHGPGEQMRQVLGIRA